MIVTRDARREIGQNSEVSVIAVGIAPPSPSPVRKRSQFRLTMPSLKADARLATPKHDTDATSRVRRP